MIIHKGELSNTQLSVIIPAYNEEDRIGKTLEDLIHYFIAKDFSWEVLIVLDGCTDATEGQVRAFTERFPEVKIIVYQPNAGKGRAVKVGMLESVGSRVLFCDADGATPIGELDKLLAVMDATGVPIVIGSRRAIAANVMQKQPWHRRFLGGLFSTFTQTVLGLPLKDTQCGFKLFEGGVARRLAEAMTVDGWSMDLELLFLAKRWGLPVQEIGVVWIDQPGSKVNPVGDGLRMVWSAVRIVLRLRKSRARSLSGLVVNRKEVTNAR